MHATACNHSVCEVCIVLAKPWPSQCSDKPLKLKGPPKLFWIIKSSTEKAQKKVVALPYFSLKKFRVNVQFLLRLVCQFPNNVYIDAPGCPANSSSLNVITALFRRQLNKPSGQSEVMKKMKTLSHMWRYAPHLIPRNLNKAFKMT